MLKQKVEPNRRFALILQRSAFKVKKDLPQGSTFSLRAGERIRGGLQNLFSDSYDEAKLLARQLELLNNQARIQFKLT